MSASHSSLSPSSAERWTNCPGSVALSATVPKPPSSPYASEGTNAHTLAEELVTGKITESKLRARIGSKITSWDGFTNKITEEMVDGAVAYNDLVKEELGKLSKSRGSIDVQSFAEAKVIAKSVDPEVRGTADWIGFKKGNRLVVLDYKFGKGVIVNPKGNKQMGIYALGAMDTIAGEAYDEIDLIIHQPRASHKDGTIRRWTATKDWFVEFREELKKAVAATRRKNAPLAAGKWCKFCPAAGVCPEISSEIQRQVEADFTVIPAPVSGKSTGLADPRAMSPERIAAALSWEDGVGSWFVALHQRARELRNAGLHVPGYKLVESRTHRQWSKDEDGVVEDLELYLDKAVLFDAPNLKSVSQVEKLLGAGKAGKGVLESLGLVTKPEGDLIIVPLDDPRPEAKSSAAQDFGVIEDLSGIGELLGLPAPTSKPQEVSGEVVEDILGSLISTAKSVEIAQICKACGGDGFDPPGACEICGGNGVVKPATQENLLAELMEPKVKRLWPE